VDVQQGAASWPANLHHSVWSRAGPACCSIAIEYLGAFSAGSLRYAEQRAFIPPSRNSQFGGAGTLLVAALQNQKRWNVHYYTSIPDSSSVVSFRPSFTCRPVGDHLSYIAQFFLPSADYKVVCRRPWNHLSSRAVYTCDFENKWPFKAVYTCNFA
jgi:hypothetical protein